MLMQPNSGETSIMAQMPQNANSREMEMMSRLSLEHFFGMSHLRNRPNSPPSRKTSMFMMTGFTMLPMLTEELPVWTVSASEIATLYAISPTTSSRATTCNRVSTKSP